MIEVTQKQTDLTTYPGRRPSPVTMTKQEVRQAAQCFLSRRLSPQAWRVIDLLATGGALSAAQLGLSDGTLRKYSHARLLNRLPYMAKELGQALSG